MPAADLPVADDAAFEAAIMLAQRVELMLDYDTNAAANPYPTGAEEKLTSMRQIRFGTSHPEERIDHGMKRIYTYGAPDIEMQATLTCTPGVLKEMLRRTVRTATGILKKYDYKIKLTNQATGVVTLGFEAVVRDHETIKPDGEGQQTVDVQCFFRITTHDKVTVT